MIDTSYVIAGAITGFIVGMTGVGDGAIMTPILLLVFGVPPMKAIATDLWFAAITKMVGASIHHGHGQLDWTVVKRLWLGSYFNKIKNSNSINSVLKGVRPAVVGLIASAVVAMGLHSQPSYISAIIFILALVADSISLTNIAICQQCTLISQ